MAALHPARMQNLAEVSSAAPREHTDIDHGSSQRLKAAAANKLSAFTRAMPSSRAETNRQRLRHEIGGTIAAFYKKAH